MEKQTFTDEFYFNHDRMMNWYTEKIITAKEAGYNYVSEAFHKIYESGKSINYIADMFGMEKGHSVWVKLKKMKINKRPRGNHKGERHIKFTPGQKNAIMNFIEELHSDYGVQHIEYWRKDTDKFLKERCDNG